MVLILWAIIIIVILFLESAEILSIALYTSFSDLESRAEVASSKTKILGFLIRALAMAILYFCPPDKFITLPEPT